MCWCYFCNSLDPNAILFPPFKQPSLLSNDECNQNGAHLCTRLSQDKQNVTHDTPAQQAFTLQRQAVLKLLPQGIVQWGKLQIDGGGDMIHVANAVHSADDHHDLTYVRVSSVLQYILCSIVNTVI